MGTHYQTILKASALVALSGILYGFLGYLGTCILQDNISLNTMLFWRFLIAGIWMIPFVVYQTVRGNIKAIKGRTLLIMFLLGALGYAGSAAFYFLASQYVGTGLAMVIFFAYPFFIALASWVLYQAKLSYSTMITLSLMLIGFYLLRDQTHQTTSLEGILFSVIAAGCYAAYIMGSKKYCSEMPDSNLMTMMVCFGGALLFLVLAVCDNTLSLPNSRHSVIYYLLLGTLVTAIPIQLMLLGLKYVSSVRASIISVLEPLVTVIVGVLLLHESVSSVQFCGAMLILGSALLVQFQKEL